MRCWSASGVGLGEVGTLAHAPRVSVTHVCHVCESLCVCRVWATTAGAIAALQAELQGERERAAAAAVVAAAQARRAAGRYSAGGAKAALARQSSVRHGVASSGVPSTPGAVPDTPADTPLLTSSTPQGALAAVPVSEVEVEGVVPATGEKAPQAQGVEEEEEEEEDREPSWRR